MEHGKDPIINLDEASFIESYRAQEFPEDECSLDTGSLQEFYRHNQAILEGQDAFRQGLQRDSNPYEREFGNISHLGWEVGWDSLGKGLNKMNEQVDEAVIAELKGVSEETANAIIANASSFKIPLHKEGSTVLNPMQMGTADELATMFAAMADVELTVEERHTTVQIIETLPEGATIKDFIDACDARLAKDLGVTAEQLEGLRPLLRALAASQ